MASRSAGLFLITLVSATAVAAACVGSEPETLTPPSSPNAPDGSTTTTTPDPNSVAPATSIDFDAGSSPPLQPMIPDAAIPDAKPEASAVGCHDGNPHVFCTTFNGPTIDAERAAKWYSVEQVGTSGLDLTKEPLPPSAPYAFRSILQPGPPGAQLARFLRIDAWPPKDNVQGLLSFETKIKLKSSDQTDIGIFALLVGTNAHGTDTVGLLARPAADNKSFDLFTFEAVTRDDGTGFDMHANLFQNAKIIADTWTVLQVGLTPHGPSTSGYVVVRTRQNISDSPWGSNAATLHSRHTTPAVWAWVGLAGPPEGGSNAEALYDDVLLDF